MKRNLRSLFLMFVVLVLPMGASASTTFNSFDFDVAQGSINYNGSTGSLYANTLIDNLTLNIGGSSTSIGGSGMTLSLNLPSDSKDFEWSTGSVSISNGSTTLLSGVLEGVVLSSVASIPTPYFTIYINDANFKYFNADLDFSLDTQFACDNSTLYPTKMNLYFTTTSSEIDPNSDFNGMVYHGSVAGHQNPVPVPAAAWIFLTGIAGLAGLRRKNKK